MQDELGPHRVYATKLIEHLPHKEFQKCVARYRGDRYAKTSRAGTSIWRWPSRRAHSCQRFRAPVLISLR